MWDVAGRGPTTTVFIGFTFCGPSLGPIVTGLFANISHYHISADGLVFQYHRQRPKLEMGLLGYDDVRGCLYSARNNNIAGDICPCASSKEGIY